MTSADGLYLDATRLFSRAWTGRRSTGIDRVSEAYCRHFRYRARAVIQFRGIVRVLHAGASDQLFERLLSPVPSSKFALVRFVSQLVANAPSRIDGNGAFYVNTSHTDFDLEVHHNWVASCSFRPIYFLHDLIPIEHPQLTTSRAVERHMGRVVGALRKASGVIVNSRSTADSVERFALERNLPIPPLIAAPLAGARFPQTSCASASRGCDGQGYFLAVGTIEPRKNYALLLQVWTELHRRLGDQCPRLVIVGQFGMNGKAIIQAAEKTPQLASHVEFVTGACDELLGRLIGGALAMVMPSLAEGFGLPLIEALQSGTPVIASDIPSFREIGQGIPLLLDPNDAQQWVDAVAQYTEHGIDRERQLGLLERFEAPSWDEHFSAIDEWLKQLCDYEYSFEERQQESCLSG